MKIRITAENPNTGELVTLAKPRTLAGAARRLIKDGEFWHGQGWDGITLEVQPDARYHAWRPLFREEVPASSTFKNRDEWSELRAQAVPR